MPTANNTKVYSVVNPPALDGKVQLMMQMHSKYSGEVLDEEQLWRPNGAFTGTLSGRIFGAGALTTAAGRSFNRPRGRPSGR